VRGEGAHACGGGGQGGGSFRGRAPCVAHTPCPLPCEPYDETPTIHHHHPTPSNHPHARTPPCATTTGVRLLVCQKNIGKSKYAFNPFQARMLPKEYKPPSTTISEGEIAT
jgi:hypothetical protein